MNPVWGGILDRYFPGIGQRQRDEELKGLIGTPAVNPAMGQSPGHPGGQAQPGSGLLGGMQMPQFLAQASAIGGRYANQGIQGMQQQWLQSLRQKHEDLQQKYRLGTESESQRLSREQNQEQFNTQQNELSAYQQGSLGNQRAANQATSGLQQFKFQHEQLAKGNKDYANFVLPWTEQIDSANTVFDAISEAGIGHNSAPLDMQLLNSFMKAMKPNEQVTEGEFKQAVDSMGIGWGPVQRLLTSGGKAGMLNTTTRKKMMTELQRLTASNINKVGEAQNRFKSVLGNVGLSEGQVGSIFGTERFEPTLLDPNEWEQIR